ncbi:peroxide stress protein YaaA [Microbacterium sp. KSW4-11]|uniref:Peroxide stress protein YaaA n=1 Tax=Microbacterium gawkjiense TaxID=3067309 RepID=A0ABU3GE57_9MICO|nr:peroxide stress protein YaaA [Microbacterium sp. KSW4-11]MDT3317781.1 peroxide stress protein YaaA [Microbacterium sp. KSW4-11]
MLILLPPSETKRPGGDGPRWRADALAYPTLSTQREQVIDALVALSDDEEAAARVLKLSARQRGEVAVNAALRGSPTMPAVDRYTGVLFDALDAATLDAAARGWLDGHVATHSAPFGLVGALDPIPAYRLGAGIRIPGLPPMRAVWADAVGAAIAASSPSFVLDLRSEAYVALGPVPAGIPQAYVRVVSEGPDGAVRALNHFNKHAKGELVRRLATSRPGIAGPDALMRWAQDEEIVLRPSAAGELELVVPPVTR